MTKDEEETALRIANNCGWQLRPYFTDLLDFASRLRDEWVKGQEPYAWEYRGKDDGVAICTHQPPDRVSDVHKFDVTPLYAAPVPQAGMVMVPRERLELWASQARVRGKELYPEGRPSFITDRLADEMDAMLAAAPNAAPQSSTAAGLAAPSQEGVGQGETAVAAPALYYKMQTRLVELRNKVVDLERAFDELMENMTEG